MKEIESGSVTSPEGFQAAGIHCGVKADPELKDLALVHSTTSASAAAVYTTNKVQAAPIAIDREHLKDGSAQTVILNSGNANACTGERGLIDSRRMCESTAAQLGLESKDVLVCSTGVIGVVLPMAAIEAGIPSATQVLTSHGGLSAAEAIMTTDTVSKSCAVEIQTAARPVRVGGMAKGAGMIAPKMATMLAVLTTDAAVEFGLLQEFLGRAVRRSFNCITVDGDMSTNDTVILLANGASGMETLHTELDSGAKELAEAIEEVCRQLAKMIARDGEGATKLVTIGVSGARHESEARKVGLAVANSSLVKTAIFGCDPNWGRILCAVGYSGIEVDPDQITLALCGTPIYGGGVGRDFSQRELTEAMRQENIPIEIDLGTGAARAEIFTCDLSYDYVRINAEYTT